MPGTTLIWEQLRILLFVELVLLGGFELGWKQALLGDSAEGCGGDTASRGQVDLGPPTSVKASCSGTRQPLLPEAAQGLVQTETSFLSVAGKF